MSDTFHEGELALQHGAGSMARLAEIGPRVIRDYMPEQHREFFAQLCFLVAGSVDAAGQPWATVLAGPPGFAHSPDPRHLAVRARPLPHDPLADVLGDAQAIGWPAALLGIEPHTRRRNRLNGQLASAGPGGFVVRAQQSFGNCPKYIQARKPEYLAGHVAGAGAHRQQGLDARAIRLIEDADTFFIASAHPLAAGGGSQRAFGVDVSHRGGKPGFVRIEPPGTLTVPDFTGNFFFNTLGNVSLNPRCGLLFIDFDHGDLLYLAARAEVVAGGAEVEAVEGALRLLRLQVVSMLRLTAALPLRWGPAHLGNGPSAA